jgi:GAF domain-containing protein
MEQSSTLMQGQSFGGASTLPSLTDLLQLPAEDDSQSLQAAAQLDLESALQLLAERAQYVMGASGAAIALRDGEEMIWRASAGPTAPLVETTLQVDSGLTAESIRKQQVLRCDDAGSDRRVDQESCRALGVKSMMVTPLVRQRETIGLFELLAERSHAFEERDVEVLERLSQMALTALECADAATQVAREAAGETEVNGKDEEAEGETSNRRIAPDLSGQVGQIQRCSGCGFPVSATRTLCFDCEKGKKTEVVEETEDDATLFLSQQGTVVEHGWFASVCYLAAVMTTVVAILWLVFRLH